MRWPRVGRPPSKVAAGQQGAGDEPSASSGLRRSPVPSVGPTRVWRGGTGGFTAAAMGHRDSAAPKVTVRVRAMRRVIPFEWLTAAGWSSGCSVRVKSSERIRPPPPDSGATTRPRSVRRPRRAGQSRPRLQSGRTRRAFSQRGSGAHRMGAMSRGDAPAQRPSSGGTEWRSGGDPRQSGPRLSGGECLQVVAEQALAAPTARSQWLES
jgi:hypothetical protein